jgi:hypothetical protein
MTNNSPMPDALTVAFPRLLSEIPEAQRAYQLITFDTIPWANEITTQFIIDGEAIDESDEPADEAITEIIEIEPDDEQDDEDGELVDEQVDLALDEPIPGDETITQFIDVPTPSRAPFFHRGRRRAKSDFPYAAALLALAGIACLAYGVVVQLSELAVTEPLLAAVSLPALVFSGVCLTLAILQKR